MRPEDKRAGRALRVGTALLCAVLPVLLFAEQARPPAGADSAWALSVTPAELGPGGSPLRYWIGVKNQAGTSMALCLQRLSFEFGPSDARAGHLAVGGAAWPIIAQRCGAHADAHLVRPGQTLSSLASVPTEGVPAGRHRISFALSGWFGGPAESERTEVTLEWTGTAVIGDEARPAQAARSDASTPSHSFGLVAEAFRGDEQAEGVWIGVRNESSSPRILCLDAARVAGIDGESGAQRAGQCPDRVGWHAHLVLPSETIFWGMTFSESQPKADIASSVDAELEAVELSFDTSGSLVRRTEIVRHRSGILGREND